MSGEDPNLGNINKSADITEKDSRWHSKALARARALFRGDSDAFKSNSKTAIAVAIIILFIIVVILFLTNHILAGFILFGTVLLVASIIVFAYWRKHKNDNAPILTYSVESNNINI